MSEGVNTWGLLRKLESSELESEEEFLALLESAKRETHA